MRLVLSLTLTDAKIIDDANVMDDPVHLLFRLTEYMDTISRGGRFQGLFEFGTIRRFTCDRCGIPSIAWDDDSTNTMIMIHPCQPNASLDLGSLLQTGLQVAVSRTQSCSNVSCGQSNRCESNSKIARLGPLLAINVVWDAEFEVEVPLEAERSGSTTAQSLLVNRNTSFVIPSKLSWDDRHVDDMLLPRPTSHWKLSGIVCRVGHMASQGHYVAIVPFNDHWWVIDDHRVFRTNNPGLEGFRDGKYPVLILYKTTAEPDMELGRQSADQGRRGHRSRKLKALFRGVGAELRRKEICQEPK